MKTAIRRLVFVTDAPQFGGAERYIVSMARAARRMGLSPGVIWCPPSDAQRFEWPLDEQSALTVLESIATGNLAGAALRFLRALHALQPDAVVFNACGRQRFWALVCATRMMGIPCAWVHHMVDGRTPGRPAGRSGYRRMDGLGLWRVAQWWRHQLASLAATRIVTSNESDAASVRRSVRACHGKLRVISPGVDPEEFRFDPAARTGQRRAWGLDQPHNPSPLVIGTAGRLVQGKRVDLLLRAAALLKSRGTPVIVAIAGQGPEAADLKRCAVRLGIENAVRFEPFINHMAGFHSALDVFVLCSETESFGLALTEAMACERPVVATPTAGSMRQIEHDISGWLLADDSASTLADALQILAADPEHRRRMGERGRKRVLAEFTVQSTLQRTLAALAQTPLKARNTHSGWHTIDGRQLAAEELP